MTLEFRSRRVHPYVVFAVPFGLCLQALAYLGFRAETVTAGSIFVACCCIAFGAAVLMSCAFNIWGRVTIERTDDRFSITRTLWRWSRTNEFFISQVRSVERYTSPPYVIVWPGCAGKHLRVFIEHRERPLSIADGLNLDDQQLHAIEELLCRPA